MLEDYKKAVISDYRYKREKGLLSSKLTHPTPALLRDECLLVLRARFDQNDESIIRDFFNLGFSSTDYSSAIERIDPDKLRPLVNFLRGKTTETEPRNVELLAWLINFEQRPYKYGVDYSMIDRQSIPAIVAKRKDSEPERPNEPTETTDTIPEDKDAPVPPTTTNEGASKKGITKKAIALLALPVLLLSGIYLYADWNKAYVCDRGTATRYHLSDKCPALKNCKNSFVATSVSEAEKNGKTLCGFEK